MVASVGQLSDAEPNEATLRGSSQTIHSSPKEVFRQGVALHFMMTSPVGSCRLVSIRMSWISLVAKLVAVQVE